MNKRRKLIKDDSFLFHSPLHTPLPLVFEMGNVEPFVAQNGWLEGAAKQVLEQANLAAETSPIALIGSTRAGRTRSMVELAQQVRKQDPSYGIVYISFNTATPILAKRPVQDPTGELRNRIAFAAFKDRKEPGDSQGFRKFWNTTRVDREWIKDWLGGNTTTKCILFIDDLNMLLDNSITVDDAVTWLTDNFLIPRGRGLVFASHVVSLNRVFTTTEVSPNDGRAVVTIPLPIIPSIEETREKFNIPDLSLWDAWYLGWLPGLIAEQNRNQLPRQSRISAVSRYLKTTIRDKKDVCKLLKTLLTGDVQGIDPSLEELMVVDHVKEDINDDNNNNNNGERGTMILRWIPFHLQYVIEQVAYNCYSYEDQRMMSNCLKDVADLLQQKFATSPASSSFGDAEAYAIAWEALFVIILIVRCLTVSFDSAIVPLAPHITNMGDDNVQVAYNAPFNLNVDFHRETDPIKFVAGIPLESWAPNRGTTTAIPINLLSWTSWSVGNLMMLSLPFGMWNGNRLLYGYQLRGDNCSIPEELEGIIHKSYRILCRASSEGSNSGVEQWQSVSDSQLDAFFGVSAIHWSAKQWRKVQQCDTTTADDEEWQMCPTWDTEKLQCDTTTDEEEEEEEEEWQMCPTGH